MKDKVNHIVNWIKDYAEKNHKTSLVVGVSGGIDSSVVSTLCAMTGIKTIPIVMTIKNKDMLALEHAWWLEEKFSNASRRVINLEKIFHEFENASKYLGADSEHAFANSRSRLRMMMLYQVATSHNGLVVGSIDYAKGHCAFSHLPNAEFKITANTLSAHAGGVSYIGNANNSIQEIKARSVNAKQDGKVELLLLG